LNLTQSRHKPGLYVGNLTKLSATGLYTLSLSAHKLLPDPSALSSRIQANDSRVSLSMTAVGLGFFVAEITADFSSFGATPLDHDGDGLFEAMEVTFLVQFNYSKSERQQPAALVSDTFSLSADLYDKCGNFVTNTQEHVLIPHWQAGSPVQVRLEFPGREIYERTSCDEECCHELGSYTLQNVACSGELPLAFESGTVLTTRSFDPAEFVHPPLDFLLIDGATSSSFSFVDPDPTLQPPILLLRSSSSFPFLLILLLTPVLLLIFSLIVSSIQVMKARMSTMTVWEMSLLFMPNSESVSTINVRTKCT